MLKKHAPENCLGPRPKTDNLKALGWYLHQTGRKLEQDSALQDSLTVQGYVWNESLLRRTVLGSLVESTNARNLYIPHWFWQAQMGYQH
jgi:hypothetical protein